MSYILEALKRSQQERELGQVPRLERGLFDTEPTPEPRYVPAALWVLATVLLAGLILAVVLYAPWLDPPEPRRAADMAAATADPPPVASTLASMDTAAAPQTQPAATPAPAIETARPHQPSATATPAASSSVSPADASPPTQAEPDPASPIAPPTSTGAPPLEVADSISVDPDPQPIREPEVLVVPAPPRPGEPLPRGAEELRRAVLGPSASPSIRYPEPTPLPAADQPVPIPDDLLADIEMFKRSVSGANTGGSDDATTSSKPEPTPTRQARTRKPAPAARVGPASATLRAKLPPLNLSVHVYDANPKRRFVYLNGRKLAEGDSGGNGLKVEQILPDGTVLSFNGERFLEPR